MARVPRPAVVVIVAATLLWTACSEAPPSGLDELRAMPESALAPPSSESLAKGGGNASQGIDGPIPAEAWNILGTNLSIPKIEDFYAGELASRGWVAGGGESGITGTHEIEARAWHRDGLVFRLGFWKLEEWRQGHKVGLDYPTIFEVRLIARGSTKPATSESSPTLGLPLALLAGFPRGVEPPGRWAPDRT